jgi:two-component system, sensor histidine kinase FlrB
MNSNQQRVELRQAFQQYNQVSDTLIESFNQLNATVDKLTRAKVENLPLQSQDNMSQQLRSLIDAIPGAVIVIDSQGKVDDYNLAASELLGEPLRQHHWRDIVHRVFLADLDQGELRTPDGRQFSISTRPLGYKPGQILLLSDVTQTRVLQRAAQQNLHLMTMGKMMASLAHQIRTPLSSSMLYLSQIIEGNLDEEKSRKFTGKALDRIRHIEKTINDMLVFAHGGQFHMSDFAITDLLAELHDHLAPQLMLKHARLKIDASDNTIFINGNKGALLGALANLCMNAMDASDQLLNIKITTALNRRGDLELAVIDNAGGMDEQTLQHLFDPFYTTKQDGTGLGLAVVKSVIESHQGSIKVSSTLGEGSRFDISLPCISGSKTQLSTQKSEANK